MAEPYLAEVRPFSFNFPPHGWAQCDGQVMTTSQNQALFALLGIQFGGNGTTTFALPELRGRVPVGIGQSYTAGNQFGTETVTLSSPQMAAHTHDVQATSTDAATTPSFTDRLLAKSIDAFSTGLDPYVYSSANNLTALASDTVSAVGGGQAHNNMQPSIAINFCIAVTGVFPSRN